MRRILLSVLGIFSGFMFILAGWTPTANAAPAPVNNTEIVSDSAAGTSATSGVSTLRVGAAKVKIKFPNNFFPYTSWGPRHFTGIHDDIYVRAIMIENMGTKALLISIETGDVNDQWLPEIAKISGVPECNIFLTATHTHSAPFVSESYPEPALQDVGKSKLFADNTWDALSEALQMSIKNMQPAKVCYATGESDINVNSDYKNTGNSKTITTPYYTSQNPHGICDKTVAVMKFADMSGQPIAYFMNYSIHPFVMFRSKNKDGGMEISGDIAGYTSRYVEDRSGKNCVALFTISCSGDTMPKYIALYNVFDAQGNYTTVDANAAGWTLVDLQAMALGTEVLRVGSQMRDFTSKIAISGTTNNITVPGKKKWHGEPYALPKDYTWEDGDPVELRLGLLMIDNVAFVGLPAEVVTSIGLDIKKTLTGVGCANALCVTQCNGSVSYISDDDGYAKRTFSANASRCKPGADKLIIQEVKNMYAVIEK